MAASPEAPVAARSKYEPVIGLEVHVQLLTKTKKPKMIVENTDRTERDEREFLETVVGVLRAIDAQVFFPIRNGMCGGCAFQKACGR